MGQLKLQITPNCYRSAVLLQISLLSCREGSCSFISSYLLTDGLNLGACIICFGWGFFVLWFGSSHVKKPTRLLLA